MSDFIKTVPTIKRLGALISFQIFVYVSLISVFNFISFTCPEKAAFLFCQLVGVLCFFTGLRQIFRVLPTK